MTDHTHITCGFCVVSTASKTMTSRGSTSSDIRRMSINDVVLPADIVKDMSVQVLKEIQKYNDPTFYEYFEGLKLDEVKKVREKVQKIRDGNREIAAKNLESEPKLEEKKTLLVERCNELKRLEEEYNQKYSELKSIEGRKSHQAVEKELQQASRKIEQESDDFAADYVGGKSSLDLEDFSQEFVKLRTLHWLRKVKAEKMKELLANYRPTPLPRSSGPTSSMPIPYSSPTSSVPSYSNPTASVPPYPVEGRMPQPRTSGGPFPMAAYASVPASIPTRPPPYTGYRMNQHRY